MQDTTIYAGWRPKVETQYINKIEFNNLNLELNNSMTGFDAKEYIKQYIFPENANYSIGNNNVWISQDDHGVYEDKLLAGYETIVTIEVYAKQYGLNIEKVDYNKLLRIVSLVSSFDIAIVVSMVAIIEKFGYVWQMILAIVIIIPLFLITYGLVAKYYKKKGMIKNV